ncbi:MAG: DNA translocase FtsK [bacterium]|nr:DNA translocase FtsK [bacterium]
MSKKSKKEDRLPLLREETLQGVLAVLFFAAGLILIFSAMGKAGGGGAWIYGWLTRFVGLGFYLLPILAFFLSAGFLRALRGLFPVKKTVGAFVLFFSGLSIIELLFPGDGGYLGAVLSSPLVGIFEIYTSLIILGACFVIALLVMFEASIPIGGLASWWAGLWGAKKVTKITGLETEEVSELEDEAWEENLEEEPLSEEAPDKKKEKVPKIKNGMEELPAFVGKVPERWTLRPYTPPPLSLLEIDKGKPGVGDIKANANIIKRTLQNFGIEVEMDEISIGPSVTRYALKPAESVRLSKIVALQRELELALAAHPIRIEAPIPGKSLVGIEIPNTVKATVGLATMLGSSEFKTSDKPLLMSLGKDLSGKAHFANLAKMPHTLIAGATGSGKSVTIHTILTSLLFRNSPDDMKLILIDPKRVELTLYNKIPHLLTPVITEAKKAILALKWAAKEMDRRYDILESETVRDIQSYHKTIVEPEYKKLEKTAGKDGEEPAGEKSRRSGRDPDSAEPTSGMPERMPYIVIIIDELADIMTTYPRELEAGIVRLAQMSRAVGIHLILSTQRPSVNVITGLIKANVPARVALQVSSQIDSRTILDTGGAEKLLGAGDMLFLSGEMSKPTRLQSAFISETEVKKVTKYLAEQYKDDVPSELNLGGGEGSESSGGSIFENGVLDDEEIDDDLYEEARGEVIAAGKASTSYLQRKLRIGYSRAARLMDILEEKGVIGAADGSKPRGVIGASGHETPPQRPEEAPGPGEL